MKLCRLLCFCIPLLFCVQGISQVKQAENFTVLYEKADKDNSIQLQELDLQNKFSSLTEAMVYINKIPVILSARGFATASVDSLSSGDHSAFVLIYVGKKYNNFLLNTSGIEKPALEASGILLSGMGKKPLDIKLLQKLNDKIISYYETKGYPFTSVFLDSVYVTENTIHAKLVADKGLEYMVDSIRVYGKARINNKFLQQHLGIANGSLYNKNKLQNVDGRMSQLPYITVLQPSDITMLGSGSVLNLYLAGKKSSQVNFIVGFVPSSAPGGKNQITGDVNLDLKNLLGSGESFLLRWQALQPKSKRLNIGFDQSYIFNSSFGFNFLFDLFKKDSNYIQVNAQAGIQFDLSNVQTGKLFLQLQNNGLLPGAIDTNNIKRTKQLPVNSDQTSINVGLAYELQTTDYRFNPRRGNMANVVGTIGTKTIKINNQVSQIKDPSFNYASLYDSLKTKSYQLRLKFEGSHYFPLGKKSTFKTAINTGWYSSPNVFRNELFQIGGYKLLRGFNEESIYANKYGVGTVEYRLLTGLNSYLFGFTDLGFAKSRYQDFKISKQYTGFGLGIVNETKIGLLNLSFAVGKESGLPFNFREAAKIHFGYVNYF